MRRTSGAHGLSPEKREAMVGRDLLVRTQERAATRAAATLSWSLLFVSILLGPMFGAAILQLPAWAQNLSPFTHTPKLPAAELTALPVLGLIAVAVALIAAGLASFRHRNLVLPA